MIFHFGLGILKNLQLGKSPQEESVTYFVSMLTVEELELAEKRDSNYMRTFSNYYPDLAEHEMKFSKSDARFVGAVCFRESLTIKN